MQAYNDSPKRVTAELRYWRFNDDRGCYEGEVFHDSKQRWTDGHQITLGRVRFRTEFQDYFLLEMWNGDRWVLWRDTELGV